MAGKVRDLNDAMDKYKADGFNEFFSLKDHGDTATVRFLIGATLQPEEDWFIVHPVQIQGKKRWVQCTEDEQCPFCRRAMRPQLKLFIQLEDSEGKTKTWERGQTMVPQLQEAIRTNGALCGRLYEVERDGVAGNEKTKYKLHPLQADGTEYEDVAEKKQTLLGENGFILQKSIEDMERMANGTYVPPIVAVNNAPADAGNQASLDQSAPPAGRQRSGEDVF